MIRYLVEVESALPGAFASRSGRHLKYWIRWVEKDTEHAQLLFVIALPSAQFAIGLANLVMKLPKTRTYAAILCC